MTAKQNGGLTPEQYRAVVLRSVQIARRVGVLVGRVLPRVEGCVLRKAWRDRAHAAARVVAMQRLAPVRRQQERFNRDKSVRHHHDHRRFPTGRAEVLVRTARGALGVLLNGMGSQLDAETLQQAVESALALARQGLGQEYVAELEGCLHYVDRMALCGVNAAGYYGLRGREVEAAEQALLIYESQLHSDDATFALVSRALGAVHRAARQEIKAGSSWRSRGTPEALRKAA